MTLYFFLRPPKVLFELNSCTFTSQLEQFFFAAHMRFKISVWIFLCLGINSIFYIITGSRKVNLNGENAWNFSVGPRQRNQSRTCTTFMALEEKACIWSTVDMVELCSLDLHVCISARKWGFHCLEMNEQATVNTSLVLSPEDWVAFLSRQSLLSCFSFLEIVDSLGFPGPVEINFLFFSVTSCHRLTLMAYWKLLLLLWIFIWIKKIYFVLVVHTCPFHTYMLLGIVL